MKIERRAKQEFKFIVCKSFLKAGKEVLPGEEIELSPDEQTGVVALGRVIPSDLGTGPSVYIALKDFFIPGSVEKYEAKKMELISLLPQDGLAQMLLGNVLPKNDHRWRPNNRRLQTDSDRTSRRRELQRMRFGGSQKPPFQTPPQGIRVCCDLARSLGIQETRFFRDTLFERSGIDEKKRTIDLSFSSEEPVERHWGIEILDHHERSVDLGRLRKGGALLVDHDRGNQIGVVANVWIDERVKKGLAQVRFSKSAKGEDIFQDVLDGIRSNVSVGYQVDEVVLEKEEKNKPSIYRVMRWEPYEISLVSVPADINVGVGRNYR